MIPKIIHQIWFQGKDKLPRRYNSYVKNIKKLHPQWEYKMWDHKSMKHLIKTEASEFLDTYENFNYMIQKIDFFRYVVLYLQGGVYLDTDIYLFKPLDNFLTEDLDMAFSDGVHEGWYVNNAFLASSDSGKKFWYTLCKNISEYPLKLFRLYLILFIYF